jgi:glycosyltransferase involved in cell wall biosynthesis
MRITFLNSLYPPYGASGAENTLRVLAAGLAARRHLCSIVTLTPDRNASQGDIDGIPVSYIPLANVYWPHGSRRPRALRPVFQAIEAFNPLMGRRLTSLMMKLRPEVLNCHNLQGFSVSAWLSAARLQIPVVQTIHDYYLSCPRSSMWRPGRGNCERQCFGCHSFTAPRRALSHIPAAVTCVSNRAFDRISDAGTFAGAVAGRRPVRIIRGCNANHSAVPSPRPPFSGKMTLGFIGRLDPSKGVDRLLEALAHLPREKVRLLVAGKGEDEYVSGLQARAATCGDVKFLGHVGPADFYGQIDLLVVPSVWEDPFPRVFHEALAFGVPTLVTPVGGLPEVIELGRTGFVATSAEPAALREVVATLLERGWDRAGMREACLEAAPAYAPHHIVDQYEAVLGAAAARAPIPEDAGEVWRPRTGRSVSDNRREKVNGT